MQDLYPSPARAAEAVGRLSFLENGRDVGLRFSFSPQSLVGLRVKIPRFLGTSAVHLQLLRDGEEQPAVFPLRLCGGDGRYDVYAVLLDAGTFAADRSLFFGSLTAESAYGTLHMVREAGARIRFSLKKEKEACFPLFFCDPRPQHQAAGGAIYALPIRELSRLGRLFRGEDTDIETFFFHLRTLGVRILWLCPPAGEEQEEVRWDPSQLPASFCSSAEKNGILLLFDLICCSGVRAGGDFVSQAESLPFTAPGEGVDDRPGFWNMPSLPAGESRSIDAYFCGRDGIVSCARQAGAGGFFVRMADRFGDALLQAIKESMPGGVLLGGVNGPPFPILFGVRRRYLFGGSLDGISGNALRRAALSYLVEGETGPLARYLGDYLPALPAHAAAWQANPLSLYGEGDFLSAVQDAYGQSGGQDGNLPRLLAELGHLLAGTLPGMPMYIAGEENGLPYPPAPGEAVGGQLAFFLRLAQLRRRETVYRGGGFRLLHLSSELLVYAREREGEALLTVINRSPARLSILSPDGFSVMFGGRGLKTAFAVRPFGGIVIKVACWEGEACRLHFTHETEKSTEAAGTVTTALSYRTARVK